MNMQEQLKATMPTQSGLFGWRACSSYMCLATSMWIINKKTVTHLPVPFFVTLVQALATCAILKGGSGDE